MAAMVKGGTAAFELVNQEKENFDILNWIDHFNEYSEYSEQKCNQTFEYHNANKTLQTKSLRAVSQ